MTLANTFRLNLALISFSACLVLLAGCGQTKDNCSDGFQGWTHNDGAGHSHSFDYSCCDLDKDEVTYTTTESDPPDGHTHQLTLTRAVFTIIGAPDWTPTYVDLNDGHYHQFYIHVPEGRCGHTN